MEEELVLDEVNIPIKNIGEKVVSTIETTVNKNKSTSKNNGFKTNKCKVIGYNKYTSTLDVNFNGYGIRIKDVKDFGKDIAIVKYKGEIGSPNFEYKM